MSERKFQGRTESVRKTGRSLVTIGLMLSVAVVVAQNRVSWRYYRVGNTGIQGDYCEAIRVAPNGDPYIGGCDPIFEEGGFAKFIRSENRWVNYSNVDSRVIGHPNETDVSRVTDIIADGAEKLEEDSLGRV